RRFKESESEGFKEECQDYMSSVPCPECKGARLKPEALAVTVSGKNIVEVSRLSIYDASHWFTALSGAEGEAEAGVPGTTRGLGMPGGNRKNRSEDLTPAPLTMREMAIG